MIHRDIKPENLLFDNRGYLKVTDFGIARISCDSGSQAGELSGTPGYMAPEVMCKMDHGISVDYYALGVIAYECMLGHRPYNGKNRKEIRTAMLERQVLISDEEIPANWSKEAADFINMCIQRKPVNRLGEKGPYELRQHPWLANFPWVDLATGALQAPFVPNPSADNYDLENSLSDWKDANDPLIRDSLELLRNENLQVLFANYEYDAARRQR